MSFQASMALLQVFCMTLAFLSRSKSMKELP